MAAPWNTPTGNGPIIAIAIHAGHRLRPALERNLQLDDATRLREEDPYTDRLAREFETHLVVHMSRFEADLNRSRDRACYIRPQDAWGLQLWKRPVPASEITRSRDLHDRFYAQLTTIIERTIEVHGYFIVYDIHSYNHRRDGPDQAPDPGRDNPSVNLGTGSLPDHWRGAADAFLRSMRRAGVDARENVRFRGGYLSTWVHRRFGGSGCALAIEFKKTFMDEWTGKLDETAFAQTRMRLRDTADSVIEAATRR